MTTPSTEPTTADLLRELMRVEGRVLGFHSDFLIYGATMPKQVDDLRREVAEAREAMTSAATNIAASSDRINDLVEQLRNAPDDAEAVESLAQELSDETDRLKAAMTPLQEPPASTEPTPTESAPSVE